MKIQRHMQQMKECDKNNNNNNIRTSKEKMESLPEEEFRVMVVKMIQNLRDKMEVQINGCNNWEDTRNIYKGPRRTKEQSTMNNVTQMKNTLEGTNSKITEAEE